MSSFPLKARVFLISVCLAGVICAVFLAKYFGSEFIHRTSGVEFAGFLLLSILVGRVKVLLIPRKHLEDKGDAGSMSLGFAITFAAMLRFGPIGAALVGLISTLASCLYPKKQRRHQLLFNVCLRVAEAALASSAWVLMDGPQRLMHHSIDCIPPILIACALFYLINTGAVATIIALCSGQRVDTVWRDSFLEMAFSYFAGAGVSTLAVMLIGNSINFEAALVSCSPVFFLIYQSYRSYASRAAEKQKHFEALQASQAQLAELYLATVKSLALAIDAKDQYTHQHILRVQRYAVATATAMGLSGGDLEGISTGALLHDIGKLGVPEYVLLKPGKLTAEEFDKVKKHPEIGAAILDPVEFPWPVLPAVKYHHEKWDGSGYPEGLSGEAIPLPGRILAVADVYDAVTSNRSYRGALTHDDAVAVIRNGTGSHFDPVVVEAFLKVIDDIVTQMAREGQGPLVLRPAVLDRPLFTKSEEAAREIQRASSELWALYEVAQTLSSSLGLQETLDILARKLAAILPGTACLFLLKNEPTEPTEAGAPPWQLTARVAVGFNGHYFAGCRTLSAECRSLQVARENRTYIGPYDRDDLMLTSSPGELWVDIQSALIVPIVHQGEVLGTINLYHTQQNAFGSHDQQLLEMIAERAAMALYNGILFDRTRSRASTDPLTGLYNVRYLTEYVDDRCTQGEPRLSGGVTSKGSDGAMEDGLEAPDRFALLCLDLDSFKPINDLLGHQRGDQVLRDVSRIFRDRLRENDVVARYGGDEFLIVLDGADRAEAQSVAEQLKHYVASYDPQLVHETLGALRIGVSIGVACYPEDGNDCGTLLSVADARMYRGKAERKLGQLIERSAERSPDLERTQNWASAEASRPTYRKETEVSVGSSHDDSVPPSVSELRETWESSQAEVKFGAAATGS